MLQNTQPRGIVEVSRCLSIKGAEDAINKPHAFEISTADQSMFFLADSDKARQAGAGRGAAGALRVLCGSSAGALCVVWRCWACAGSGGGAPRATKTTAARAPRCLPQEKEDWINAVGRAIVRHSKRCAATACKPVPLLAALAAAACGWRRRKVEVPAVHARLPDSALPCVALAPAPAA